MASALESSPPIKTSQPQTPVADIDPFVLTLPGRNKREVAGCCQSILQQIGGLKQLWAAPSRLPELARKGVARFEGTMQRYTIAKASTDGVLSGVSSDIDARAARIKGVGTFTLPPVPEHRPTSSFGGLMQTKAKQLLSRKPSAESPSDSSQRPFVDSLGRPTVDFTGAPLSEPVLRQLTNQQAWQFFAVQSVENLLYKWVDRERAMRCDPDSEDLLAKRAEESMRYAKIILGVQEVPLERRAATLVLSIAELDIGANQDWLMLCEPAPEGRQEPAQDVNLTI